MFEFIRNHNRLMQIFLMLLIVPSFVLVGVTGLGSGDAANEVAIVGGTKITQQQWDTAQRQQLDQYRQKMGASFDSKVFESPEAKQAVLDRLVTLRAIDVEVAKNNMHAGDKALKQSLFSDGSMLNPDGSLNKKLYEAVLSNMGMTVGQYEEGRRSQLTAQQFDTSLTSTAILPRTVAKRLSDISAEEREVQEMLLPGTAYSAQVNLTPAMLKAYYDKNAALFTTPEQAQIEYLVFSLDNVASQVSVSDEEAQEVYKRDDKPFLLKEERKVSQILFNASKDATAAEKAAAKAKAEAVLAQVRAAPGEFASIAKKNSEDPASAEVGGDLGVVTAETIEPALYDAASKLKEGEISGLVESRFGYHIVKLTAFKPGSVKPFETVKDSIVAQLKTIKAGKLFKEQVEVFNDMLYSHGESLKPAADKFKLAIASADGVTRTPSQTAGTAPYNHPKLLEALFANDSLKKKNNTESIEVAPNTLVAARIVNHKPAFVRPLAEVEPAIRERVTVEQAIALARKDGEAKLAALKVSGDATGFGAPVVISRSKPPAIDPQAGMAVMKADIGKLPAYFGLELPGKGYGVYRIGKVSQPATPDLARRSAEQEQIATVQAQQELFAYIEALKAKATTKLLVKPAVAPK